MIHEFNILGETASSHHCPRKMVLPYPPIADLHRCRMDLVVWCPQLRVPKPLSCLNVFLSTMPGSHCTGHTSQESVRNLQWYHSNMSKSVMHSEGVVLIILITVHGPDLTCPSRQISDIKRSQKTVRMRAKPGGCTVRSLRWRRFQQNEMYACGRSRIWLQQKQVEASKNARILHLTCDHKDTLPEWPV